ncbi:phage major capsid protein [Nocardioides sp. BYT-33-1]|uniref:phage major capsid protein n=1 Tax=Nocardioides sp. BYT-33-1 TaxID=3416952 RepID=UPI003F53A5DA
MVTQLSNVNPTLLPPTITGPIFDQAIESSAVMSLARRVPLSLTANTAIPVSMDIPAAGWVSEGGAKPVGAGAVGIKTMTGKKVALLVPVSEEVARSNPAGLYAQLRQDLPVAIGRAFDYAAIHGKDLRTGGAGPFTDYLTKNASSVELGTATQADGGMYADLVGGEKLVVDAGYDFSGFAADPRLKPLLKLETDTTGRPLWVDAPQQGANTASLIGYPAAYNRGVSGTYRRSGNRVQVVTITGTPTGGTFALKYGGQETAPIAYNAAAGTVQTAIRALGGSLAGATVAGSAGGPYTITIGVAGSAAAPFVGDGSALTGGTDANVVVGQSPDADSNLRAIGGDWSQCAYGVGMDITIKVSTEASYVDLDGNTHSAFQDNLVLLLVEAYYGFVTSDALGAFVAYSDAA